jgi:hypothetical protein
MSLVDRLSAQTEQIDCGSLAGVTGETLASTFDYEE